MGELSADLTKSLTGKQADSEQRLSVKGASAWVEMAKIAIILNSCSSIPKVLTSYSKLVYLSLQVAILMLISSF